MWQRFENTSSTLQYYSIMAHITYSEPSITVNYPDGTSAHTGPSSDSGSGSGSPSGSGAWDDYQRERDYAIESSRQNQR